MKTPDRKPLPEPPEPREERGFIPVGLIGLLALLAFLGDMYFVYHGLDIGGKGGAFPPQVYFPYPNYAAVADANPGTGGPDAAMGKKIYNGPYCVPCHQANGMGTPGMFPPLAASEWVTTENPENIIRIVLNGIAGPITVSGQQFNNVMPPWRDALTDDQIAAVITYIRSDWGNKASPVTPDLVKKVREATTDKGGPWSAEELKAIGQ